MRGNKQQTNKNKQINKQTKQTNKQTNKKPDRWKKKQRITTESLSKKLKIFAHQRHTRMIGKQSNFRREGGGGGRWIWSEHEFFSTSATSLYISLVQVYLPAPCQKSNGLNLCSNPIYLINQARFIYNFWAKYLVLFLKRYTLYFFPDYISSFLLCLKIYPFRKEMHINPENSYTNLLSPSGRSCNTNSVFPGVSLSTTVTCTKLVPGSVSLPTDTQ